MYYSHIAKYPKVPRDSHPSKLLYGHAPRGLLDVLRETWEGMGKSLESVVSHILMMWDRMELMRENLEKAQHTEEVVQPESSTQGAEGWL